MEIKKACTGAIIAIQLFGTILLILSIAVPSVKILGNIGVGIMGLANIVFGYVINRNKVMRQGWSLIISGIVLLAVSIITLIFK